MQIITRKMIERRTDSELTETSVNTFTPSQLQASYNSWGHLVFRGMRDGEERLVVFDASETKEVIRLFKKLKEEEIPF